MRGGDDGEDVVEEGGCLGGCVGAGEMLCAMVLWTGNVWEDVWMDAGDDRGNVWGIHGVCFRNCFILS